MYCSSMQLRDNAMEKQPDGDLDQRGIHAVWPRLGRLGTLGELW